MPRPGTTPPGASGLTAPRVAAGGLALLAAVSCSYDRGDRWLPGSDPSVGETCHVGDRRCGTGLEECVAGASGPAFRSVDDCASRGLVCAPLLRACTACIPGEARCNGSDVEVCSEDGSGFVASRSCDTSRGVACRSGLCVDLCGTAADERSNVGCEYWAADLDNADIEDSQNAAAQQYAVTVSNPQPDVAAVVTVEQDDTAPGTAGKPVEIARTTVPPLSLRVLKLGPREVDGSPPGKYDAGTNTALTRAAFRLKSSVPIIAYQFNPLDNVNVFSNDASLLKPVEALDMGSGTEPSPAYVVLGWPQTIAATDDPNTNFSPGAPLSLRAFLTIVGTRSGTKVRIHPKARVLGGGPIPETKPGGSIELTLDPFDVANLETGDFGADFTGSIIEANGPIVVFSGNEASDAPAWKTLAERRCCADHLEEQLDPIRTAGRRFVGTISPNRTDALVRAGATTLGHFDAPEFFRVAAATEAGAIIRTTLPAPLDRVVLNAFGDFASITATKDFVLESDQPIFMSSVSPSQGASGVPFSLPGGDPSFVAVPPVEQFREDYVFLTPDKYAFDFVRIVAPAGAPVQLDGSEVGHLPSCEKAELPRLAASDEPLALYRCQLGFPVIDTSLGAAQLLSPGAQNDGVHRVVSSRKLGVIVDGFDKNVSYAYAAGTELTELLPAR